MIKIVFNFNFRMTNKFLLAGILSTMMTTSLVVRPAISKPSTSPIKKACEKDNSGVGNNLHGQTEFELVDEVNTEQTYLYSDGQSYELSIDLGNGDDYQVRIDPDNRAQMEKLRAYLESLVLQGKTNIDIDAVMATIEKYELEANTTQSDGNKKVCAKNSYLDADYTNTSELDLDSDGLLDEQEGLDDDDSDGSINLLDSDIDGDKISDFVEAGFNVDNDEDGIPDNQNPVDTDEDGIVDYLDSDSDNDGIPDKKEYIKDINNDVDHDVDKDGIYNFRDLDSDNDGKPDAVEVGADPENPVDTDGNGIPDFLQKYEFAD